VLLPVLSVVAALAAWELISRTELISQRDLPAMSTAFHELGSFMTAREFWVDYWETIRGWGLGIAIATVLAVPTGIVLDRATSSAPRSGCRSSFCDRFRPPR